MFVLAFLALFLRMRGRGVTAATLMGCRLRSRLCLFAVRLRCLLMCFHRTCLRHMRGSLLTRLLHRAYGLAGMLRYRPRGVLLKSRLCMRCRGRDIRPCGVHSRRFG